jgi:hypothetical protein
MFKNKMFWYVCMMPGGIIGWIFIIYGLINPIDNASLRTAWYAIMCIWGIGHPLELFTSIPIGKQAGVSTGMTVVKTLLFGITWWFPLKMGILDK